MRVSETLILYVRPKFLNTIDEEETWYHLAYATEIKSIQLYDSIVMALPWDSISVTFTQVISVFVWDL